MAIGESGEQGKRKTTRSRANPKRYKDREGREYRLFTFRLFESEYERLEGEARLTDHSLGRYIVERALNNPVRSHADAHAVAELRRIGAMLKHLYPKDSNWTNADKRQYWDAMNELLEMAKSIEAKVV